MDLSEFVEMSLIQIIEGVNRAQKATRLAGRHASEADVVNPAIMYSADGAPKGKYFATIERNLVHFVDFDVAVTTESTLGTSGGGKIRVLGIGVGAEGSTQSKDLTASRIKFQVPISLPRSVDET
jgi:hypothetical protein